MAANKDNFNIDEFIKEWKNQFSTANSALADEAKRLGLKNEEAIGAYRQQSLIKETSSKLKREITLLEELNQEATDLEIARAAALQKKKDLLEAKSFGNISKERLKVFEKEAKQAEKNAKRVAAEKEWAESGGTKGVLKKEFSAFNKQLSDGFGLTSKKVGAENLVKSLKGVIKAVNEGMDQINSAINSYAKYQTAINTRLQGVSSFSKATNALSGVAYSPLISAQSLYENLNTLVGEGVATNVEQRAFLMTVKEGIATTFDANSDSIKRIIRLQQEDSTAARLGMESYLTKFLNEYVKNTEYLTTTFDSVADSLLEASVLLRKSAGEGGIGASEEFEYIVQKWLGVLSGVGLSSSSTSSLASAIGDIGSGNIGNLGSGISNLLLMGASKAGLDYSSLLSGGLDALDANKLLYGTVAYIQELGGYENNVIKSQLAKTFGINVSDLVAVSNLQNKELKTIYNSAMSYTNMYSELSNQMNTLASREGVANILQNLFSNLTYQTGMSIANNSVAFATWKITDLISNVTGGINIPFITALGTGVDLNTTVENLIKLGIVGVDMLGNIGNIVSGVGSAFGVKGSTLLSALGIAEGKNLVSRGTGLADYTLDNSGLKKRVTQTTSASTYVGNINSDVYQESALDQGYKSSQDELDKKKKEASEADPLFKYLKEGKIVEAISSIDKNIKSLATDGVTLKAFSSNYLAGFYKEDRA